MKHLTDNELLKQTKKLVQQERELLTQVLEHLREISDRKLFSELGYKSLFEFAVKHLGYSEDQSYRRIAAMKLVKQVPGLEEKIENGEVHLTHISLAQSLFRQVAKLDKPFSPEQKQEVFNRIAGTSVREAEKITVQMSSRPETLTPEKVRAISEDAVSIQVTIKNETLLKMETLKGWLSHKFPNLSTGELIEKLCELGMVEWNPSKPVRKPATSKPSSSRGPTAQMEQKIDQAEMNSVLASKQKLSQTTTITTDRRNSNQSESSELGSSNSTQFQKRVPNSSPEEKAIPAPIRRKVFQTAQNQCEKCQSHFLLEVDHLFPKALGGSNDLENLRLLCRNCNQRSAINAFGKEKVLAHAYRHSSESRMISL